MSETKPAKVSRRPASRELAEGPYTPLADIYETDAELVLVADVPGVSPEALNLQVDKGVLTLEAESTFDVPGEEYARTYVGFEPGTFFRAFALSDEIDREKISAEVSGGVVTVHLPKAPSAKSRKIEIKTA
jgi:HSP20 family molecular chaperone IbpA